MKKFIFLVITIILTYAFAALPPTQLKGGNEAGLSTTFNFNLGQIPVTRTGTNVTFGTIPVTQGGTSQTTLTQYSLMSGDGTNAVNMIAPAASGTILFSNGASAFPSYRLLASSDITTSLGYTPLASTTAAIISTLGYTPVATVSAGTGITLTGGASNPVVSISTTGVSSGASFAKVTVDGTGRVVSGNALTESDIPSLQTTKITSGIFAVANGGTGVSTTATGNLLVGSGTAWVNLPIGASGTALISSGGTATWGAVSTGTVFNNITLSGTTIVSGTFVSGYANYGNVSSTVLTSQRFITLSNSGTTVTFTLPTTSVSTGTQITFVRNVTTAATQSIISVGAGNLCGNLTSVKLSGVNDSMTFFYDGANWQSPDCYRTVSYTTNSGCTTVGQIVGNAALSASSGGTGQCSVTMYSGIFSSAPNCLVNTSALTSSSGEVAIGIVSEATTNFAWFQAQPGVGAVNRFSFVTCNGPR